MKDAQKISLHHIISELRNVEVLLEDMLFKNGYKNTEKIIDNSNLRDINHLIKEIESSRLAYFIKSFNISSSEVLILLICILPYINIEYDKLFTILNDNKMKNCPTIGLILNLLYSKLEDRIAAFELFSAQSILFKFKILEFIN